MNLSSCAVDTDYINELTAKKPSILVVNYSNPFAINEIYNEQTQTRFKGILATFGVEPEALLDVVTGKFNPTGKMPFTTPKSKEVVETNKEDVPGYDEGPEYPLFKFGEGGTY